MGARPEALTTGFRPHDPLGMDALGQTLGRAARSILARQLRLLVGLDGELGTGKTTLVAGALKALGVDGPVTSPTYGLVHPYSVRLENQKTAVEVLHVDLYRLRQSSELAELGLFDDAAAAPAGRSRLLLVEWFAVAQGLLGQPDVLLRLKHARPGRIVEASGYSAAGRMIAQTMQTEHAGDLTRTIG